MQLITDMKRTELSLIPENIGTPKTCKYTMFRKKHPLTFSVISVENA